MYGKLFHTKKGAYMINNKLLFFALFYISSLLSGNSEILLPIFFTAQVNNTKAYVCYIPQPTQNVIQKNGWDYFHHCCFTMPNVLKKAQIEQCPFILVLPQTYDGYTPVAFEAPIIEGARVALTWSSAYYRFKELGNVDVQIILIPKEKANDISSIKASIHQALTQNIKDESNASPEQCITKRIYQAGTLSLNTENAIEITPYNPPTITKKPTIIPTKLNPNIKNKRIVITGAAGFLGSHLAQELIKKDYQVIAIDNLSCCTGENINHLKNHPNFDFHQIDISQPFDINGPIDIIVHLASVPSPAYYYTMPIETLQAGLHGTKEALELARRKNAQLMFASSSEVYGDPKVHPQTESYPGSVDPTGKRSQYDESKRGAETLIKLYFEKYNLDVRITRLFNTFGPGMRLSDGRAITNFIQATLDDKPMLIYGDGNQTRSPAYVSDTIEGLLRIIESDTIRSFKTIEERIFNIGNPEEYSVNEIASCINKIAQKHLQKTITIKHIPQFDVSDPKVRQPDISYVHKITHFQPLVPFQQGLEKTFLYYYKNRYPKTT